MATPGVTGFSYNIKSQAWLEPFMPPNSSILLFVVSHMERLCPPGISYRVNRRGPGGDSVDAAVGKIALAEARRAIAKLPVDLREVLVLVSIEELPYREAAEVLGIPIGTVMSRLSRARLTLYEMMAEPKTQMSKPFGRKR